VRRLNEEAGIKHIRGEPVESNEEKLSELSTATPISSSGKEPNLEILQEAGITDLDQEAIDRLPTWKEVRYVHLFNDCVEVLNLFPKLTSLCSCFFELTALSCLNEIKFGLRSGPAIFGLRLVHRSEKVPIPRITF
jgi:hypothetical protein